MNDGAIQYITTEQLGRMTDREGLILQGCGGDPAEWLTGMNDLFTKEGILLDGGTFKDICVFEHDGHTNIMFGMEDVRLDIGKLAMWRLANYAAFGGYWLSDYLSNRMGIDTAAGNTINEKPKMQLDGMDGNIFDILGRASKLLKQNGLKEQAAEMFERATAAKSYDSALMIVSEYVQTELSDPQPFVDAALDNTEPKRIYICAPLRSDVARNAETARLCAKEVFDAGDIPICPHLVFPPIADPKNPVQDEKAFGMCLKLVENCHQVNVYGQPTEGMKAEIALAKRLGIPVCEVPPAKEKTQNKSSQRRNTGR